MTQERTVGLAELPGDSFNGRRPYYNQRQDTVRGDMREHLVVSADQKFEPVLYEPAPPTKVGCSHVGLSGFDWTGFDS